MLAIQEQDQYQPPINQILPRMLLVDVVDSESYVEMETMYKQARGALKLFEAQEMMELAPLKQRMAEIKERIGSDKKAIEQAIDCSKAKMIGYQKMIDQKKKEADEELMQTAKLMNLQVYVEDSKPKSEGMVTTTYTRKVKRFRITDESLVPRMYMKIDEDLVKVYMKQGKIIPGIEYYEEESLNLRMN